MHNGASSGCCGTFVLEANGPCITSSRAGIWTRNFKAAFFEYVNVQVAVDPMVEAMQNLPPGQLVRTRPQVVNDRTWYRSVHVAEFRRRAYIDESVYAIYPFDTAGNAVGMGFTRQMGAARFTVRERSMIEMLNDGLAWFYHQLREDGTRPINPACRRHYAVHSTAY